MKTSRFEPNPGVNYGKCRDCDFAARTETDAHMHQFKTLMESPPVYPRRGHTIVITNPSREQRMQKFMDAICAEAIASVFKQIDKAVSDNDITKEEAREALAGVGGFYVAWEEAKDRWNRDTK